MIPEHVVNDYTKDIVAALTSEDVSVGYAVNMTSNMIDDLSQVPSFRPFFDTGTDSAAYIAKDIYDSHSDFLGLIANKEELYQWIVAIASEDGLAHKASDIFIDTVDINPSYYGFAPYSIDYSAVLRDADLRDDVISMGVARPDLSFEEIVSRCCQDHVYSVVTDMFHTLARIFSAVAENVSSQEVR